MPPRASLLRLKGLDDKTLAEARQHVRQQIGPLMGPHVRQGADSDDIVGSALGDALLGQEEGKLAFAGREPLLAWLMRTAINKVRSRGRRWRQPVTGRQSERGWREEQVVSPGPGPVTEASNAEEKDRLIKKLHQLQVDDQAVIINRFYLGHRGAALGRALGVSDQAAAHRLKRALSKLETLLREED